MEYYRDDRCCDYYEKERVVYEEPHHRHLHHHSLSNNNTHGDSFRFKEERRFEDKYRPGGHLAGGESRIVTYKVEETDYSLDEAAKDGEYRTHHYGRHIF